MSWLAVAVFSYLILAVVYLVDKHLLTGSVTNPKVYTFYVGILWILVLFLVPFVDFYVPEMSQIVLSLSAGAVFIWGLLWFYKALHLFEASRVVPAVGSLTPLFTFILIYVFTSRQETLSFNSAAAFVLLILGNILINLRREKFINFRSFRFSVLTAFFFSLAFILAKYVYLAQPFWNGFIWRSIGGFLMAVCFLFIFPEIRKELFSVRKSLLPGGSKKTSAIFVSNQLAGAGSAILQNWAIFLAPLALVPVIHALSGTQYVFLFIFSIFLSLKFPKILKEEVSRDVILQKIVAIILIGGGLVLLSI
jgi:drug/metabolite transporter (DMT)-like permease